MRFGSSNTRVPNDRPRFVSHRKGQAAGVPSSSSAIELSVSPRTTTCGAGSTGGAASLATEAAIVGVAAGTATGFAAASAKGSACGT